MTISTDSGNKAEGDQIIKYNGLPISFKEIAKVMLKLWDNEDLLYPPSKGLRGAKMSMDFLNELFEKRDLTKELLGKYYLK